MSDWRSTGSIDSTSDEMDGEMELTASSSRSELVGFPKVGPLSVPTHKVSSSILKISCTCCSYELFIERNSLAAGDQETISSLDHVNSGSSMPLVECIVPAAGGSFSAQSMNGGRLTREFQRAEAAKIGETGSS